MNDWEGEGSVYNDRSEAEMQWVEGLWALSQGRDLVLFGQCSRLLVLFKKFVSLLEE